MAAVTAPTAPAGVTVPAAVSCRPTDAEALLKSAKSLAGLSLEELSRRVGIPLPAEPTRVKGYIGRLVERALGAGDSDTRPATDFPQLGIELKTLPVDREGRPRESTFVCHVDLKLLAEVEWEGSRVREKLARVLFVPIESAPGVAFEARRIGAAFLWTPSAEHDALLRADYEEIAGRVGMGEIETLDGRVGRVLQTRPKAPNARTRTRVADADGASQTTFPRAFYLRAAFTESLLRAAFALPPRDRTVF